MEFNFSGKSVLVTGSSRGIGKAIGEAFLENGADVIFNGTNLNKLQELKDELNIDSKFLMKGDVRDVTQVNNLILEAESVLKKIDIIVCNVGSGRSVRPGEENYSEWQRVFNQNLWSTTNVVEAGKAALKKTNGSFICISSICGHEVIDNAPITYSTAKAALNFYIKAISRPLGKEGIRINGISPGNILFKGSTWEEKLKDNTNNIDYLLRNVPLSKFGKTSDISNTCLWLASENSTFCTGSIFAVDGGQLRS